MTRRDAKWQALNAKTDRFLARRDQAAERKAREDAARRFVFAHTVRTHLDPRLTTMMKDADDPARKATLQVFADALETAYGPCLLGRAVLVDWLTAEFQRLAAIGAPGYAAGQMVAAEYMLWQAESVGLDINDD